MIDPKWSLRDLANSLAQLNAELARADVNQIWNHSPLPLGASDAEISSLKSFVGQEIPDDYIEFLKIFNGWDGFFPGNSLFSTMDVVEGRRVSAAWELLEAADEGSGGILGLDRSRYLPIAASQNGIDVFILELSPVGHVRWIAGQEIEEFGSFRELIEAVFGYNSDTLSELKSDPWLGAG